ncbi:hypothetical protein TNCV_4858901 [Trichonephila clavipes]|nr:hypothetical protein TNCV_4858901 [Trichonephila clavipes]
MVNELLASVSRVRTIVSLKAHLVEAPRHSKFIEVQSPHVGRVKVGSVVRLINTHSMLFGLCFYHKLSISRQPIAGSILTIHPPADQNPNQFHRISRSHLHSPTDCGSSVNEFVIPSGDKLGIDFPQ